MEKISAFFSLEPEIIYFSGCRLTAEAGPKDFVIVAQWFCGLTFDRYYQGTAPWSTLPPLTDHLRNALSARSAPYFGRADHPSRARTHVQPGGVGASGTHYDGFIQNDVRKLRREDLYGQCHDHQSRIRRNVCHCAGNPDSAPPLAH